MTQYYNHFIYDEKILEPVERNHFSDHWEKYK